jgi:ArsR family transcriptional regulator
MSQELLPEPLLERVARRFKILSEPVRLQLLNQLQVHGEMNVQQLVEATDQRQANVSKHLGIMKREGLVQRRKEGLHVYYSIDDPSIQALCLLVCGQLREEDRSRTDVISEQS